MIKTDGERIPSYENSQKDFRVAFVVVVPAGDIIDPAFVEYVNLYKQALPQAWSDSTSQKSRISF